MFEFEELSTGFHEILLNKYADSPGPILDLFISDSMQEMLDIDIRSEVATVATGTSEFSSLINDLPASLELDITSNDGEISWLGGPWWSTSTTTDIYADVGACVNPNSVMPMPLITESINSSKTNQFNVNTTTTTILTNNSHVNNNSPPQSPKENKSHLTFSPHQIKVPPVQDNHKNKGLSPLVSSTTLRPSTILRPSTTSAAAASTGNLRNKNLAEIVKKDLSNDLMQEENASARKVSSSNITQNSVLSTNILSGSNTIKLAPGIGGLTFSNSLSYNKLKQSNNVKSLNVGGNIIIKSEKESSSSSNNNHQQHNNILNWIPSNGNIQNSNKTLSRSILVQNNKNFSSNNGSNSPNPHHKNHHQQQQQQQQQSHHHQNNLHTKPKLSSKPIDYEYPKPAYSYSCLIAMALKNSRSGSLPVSEIYSFMCEHFPYFKTAPNGWKNSVRHNLSLNKCFEKIEKPATNGSQRKGCLWAMNPAKITKMDEEVQKWSRKDPLAIRKAMVFPEHLEALERGEMKHGSTGDSDNENEAQSDTEENFEDSEQEHEQDSDENLIKTPESLVNEDEEGDDAPVNGDKEYEVEMTDFYDSIDLDDDKESVRRIIHQQNDLLASGKGGRTSSEDYSASKRARLDVNYSIGPAGVFDQQQKIHHHQQHQQQQQTQPQLQQPTVHHNRRKMQLVNRIA